MVVVGATVRAHAGPGDSLVAATSRPAAVMGTSCTLTAIVPREKNATAHQALAEAESVLRRVESLMSTYRDASEVRRLKNASAKQHVVLSRETCEVLRSARRFAEISGGAFDVTAAPLFRLWRQCADLNRLPTRDELTAARAASSWDNLTLLEDGAVKANPFVEVDLGGIAKGYAVDRAIEKLQEAGCVGGLVEVGGDLRCFGTKPGGHPWRIAVRAPVGPPQAGVLELTSAAVCTSGDYLRFVEIKGKRFSHIIDPRSCLPAEAVPSVTIIARDATTADGLATTVSVLGPEKGLNLVESLDGVHCLLMVRGSEGRISLLRSAGFPDLIQAGEGLRDSDGSPGHDLPTERTKSKGALNRARCSQ